MQDAFSGSGGCRGLVLAERQVAAKPKHYLGLCHFDQFAGIASVLVNSIRVKFVHERGGLDCQYRAIFMQIQTVPSVRRVPSGQAPAIGPGVGWTRECDFPARHGNP